MELYSTSTELKSSVTWDHSKCKDSTQGVVTTKHFNQWRMYVSIVITADWWQQDPYKRFAIPSIHSLHLKRFFNMWQVYSSQGMKSYSTSTELSSVTSRHLRECKTWNVRSRNGMMLNNINRSMVTADPSQWVCDVMLSWNGVTF